MKSIKNGKKRGNPATYFKAGHAPTSPGRPRKDQSYNDVTREMLAAQKIDIKMIKRDGSEAHIYLNSDHSLMHAVIAGQIKAALVDGDTQAANHLADRGYGKVTDKLQVEAEGEIKVTFREIPSEPA